MQLLVGAILVIGEATGRLRLPYGKFRTGVGINSRAGLALAYTTPVFVYIVLWVEGGSPPRCGSAGAFFGARLHGALRPADQFIPQMGRLCRQLFVRFLPIGRIELRKIARYALLHCARRRSTFPRVKLLLRVLTALNLLPSIATLAVASRPTWRHRSTNCMQTCLIADPQRMAQEYMRCFEKLGCQR
jgi:hypothetical protein